MNLPLTKQWPLWCELALVCGITFVLVFGDGSIGKAYPYLLVYGLPISLGLVGTRLIRARRIRSSLLGIIMTAAGFLLIALPLCILGYGISIAWERQETLAAILAEPQPSCTAAANRLLALNNHTDWIAGEISRRYDNRPVPNYRWHLQGFFYGTYLQIRYSPTDRVDISCRLARVPPDIGLERVAMRRFGRTLDHLTSDELAQLLEMAKNPSRYRSRQVPSPALPAAPKARTVTP